jgi:hypothetical protein
MAKSRSYRNKSKRTRRLKNRNRRKSKKSIRGGGENVVNMYFRDYEMYQSKLLDKFRNSEYIIDLIHKTDTRLKCKKIKLKNDDIVLVPKGIDYKRDREIIGEEITRMYYAMIEYFKTLPDVKIDEKLKTDIIDWIQEKYNTKNRKEQIKIIQRTNKEEIDYIYDNDQPIDYDADDARNLALTVKGTEAGL